MSQLFFNQVSQSSRQCLISFSQTSAARMNSSSGVQPCLLGSILRLTFLPSRMAFLISSWVCSPVILFSYWASRSLSCVFSSLKLLFSLLVSVRISSNSPCNRIVRVFRMLRSRASNYRLWLYCRLDRSASGEWLEAIGFSFRLGGLRKFLRGRYARLLRGSLAFMNLTYKSKTNPQCLQPHPQQQINANARMTPYLNLFLPLTQQMQSSPSARRSPSIHRQKSISSSQGSNGLDTSSIIQSSPLAKTELQQFNSRFSELYTHIEQDVQPSNDKLFFNFITWEVEKEKSMKFDPQIVSSRLKQLENRMELGRADMELDKRQSPRKAKTHRRPMVATSPSYLEMYEKGIYKQPVFEEIPQNIEESNDEEEEAVKPEKTQDIMHFNQLKKRPMVLGYFLNKLRVPTPKKQEPLVFDLKEENTSEYIAAMKKLSKNRDGPNPEQIIQMQYPKFFNRMHNQSLSQQIRQKPICKRLVSLHERFIDNSPQISDQNKRKLQQKLNHIVRQIAKSDRYSQNKKPSSPTKLPRLSRTQNLV